MSNLTLNALLEFVKADGRICPMPPEWNALWKMLPNKRRATNGWEPPLRLILGAWDSPVLFKQLRLAEHIQYGAEHGVLENKWTPTCVR